jgi:cell division protein FtsB
MAMHRVMNKKGFLMLAGLMLAVFLGLHLWLGGMAREKELEKQALQEQQAAAEARNQQLTDQMEKADTDDYITTSAMMIYGYQKEGDILFKFTNPEALYAYTEEEIRILMDEMAD